MRKALSVVRWSFHMVLSDTEDLGSSQECLFLEASLPAEQFNALHCPPYTAPHGLYARYTEHVLPQSSLCWAFWWDIKQVEGLSLSFPRPVVIDLDCGL